MAKNALAVVEDRAAGVADPDATVADPSKTSSEQVTDLVLELLKLGLDALKTDLQAIISGADKDSKHDKASRIAFITQKAGSIADSIRKVEAARAKRNELTPAIVVAYLRSCDSKSRRLVLSELEGLSGGGSVLG